MSPEGSSPKGDAVVRAAVLRLLTDARTPFERIEHPPVSSAEEAAQARGTPLERGVKAILFKIDRDFAIFAMNAACALHSAKVRKVLGVRRTRFASRDELLAMTGLAPGGVPPFGEPVLPFPLYADPSVFVAETLVFTAGRTTSIQLASADYRDVAAPRVFAFTRAENKPSC